MIKEMLDERESKYGPFRSHAEITQAFKSIAKDTPGWLKCDEPMREALEMTFHKIGRILNGDPYYKDSWVDIVGYNQLIVDEFER